jgi:hypothetical protein
MTTKTRKPFEPALLRIVKDKLKENHPHVQLLAGVVHCPVVRPDGTILTEPGFDPATKLVNAYEGSPVEYHDRPTPAQVQTAAQYIRELWSDFPMDDTSLSVYLTLLFMALFEAIISGCRPAFGISAFQSRSGKGLLCKCHSIISMGGPAAMSPLPAKEEEMAKVILGYLMTASPFCYFDNIDRVIKSNVLEGMITAGKWKGRLLGGNVIVELDVNMTLVFTGNGLEYNVDMIGRTLTCEIKVVSTDRPGQRSGFKQPNLEQHLMDNRHVVLGHMCTLARAYACRPGADANTPFMLSSAERKSITGLGAFEGIEAVRHFVMTTFGLPDPVKSQDKMREEGAVDNSAASVLEAWQKIDPMNTGKSVKGVLQDLERTEKENNGDPEVIAAFKTYLGYDGRAESCIVVAQKLLKYKDVPVRLSDDGLWALKADKNRTKVNIYSVRRLLEAEPQSQQPPAHTL